MKILLATRNPAKIKDYQRILEEEGLSIATLESLGIKDEFKEAASTFEENAKAKTLFYHQLSGLPTLADDGGFEIDYLKGQPGVLSRRWIDPTRESSDQEIVEHLSQIILKIPLDQRTARFTTVLCLVKSAEEIYFAENSITGQLTEKFHSGYPKGFPYRAHFVEKTFSRHLMDLTEEEYDQINHRRKNVKEIIGYL